MRLNYFNVGALLCGLAVAAGAFGAHALRSILDSRSLEIFETATRYQMYHGLALLMLARAELHLAAKIMLIGVMIFSGSLYALVFSGMNWFGAITPIGGILLLIGWGMVFIKSVHQSE